MMPTDSPSGDGKVDILQHMDRGCGVSERQIGLLEFDDGFSHAFPPYIEWREEVVAHRPSRFVNLGKAQ